MNRYWRIREALALWLLGGKHVIDIKMETNNLYESVWPKNDVYEQRTRQSMRIALVRSYLRGKRQARVEG